MSQVTGNVTIVSRSARMREVDCMTELLDFILKSVGILVGLMFAVLLFMLCAVVIREMWREQNEQRRR